MMLMNFIDLRGLGPTRMHTSCAACRGLPPPAAAFEALETPSRMPVQNCAQDGVPRVRVSRGLGTRGSSPGVERPGDQRL